MRPVALLLALLAAGCQCSDNTVPAGTQSTVPEAPHDIGQWLSMATMPDGQIAAAWYDRTQGGLTFALATPQAEGLAWSEERVDGFPDENGLDSGDRGRYASLAVAADGTAWVVYEDTTNGAQRYARRDPDGTWTTGPGDPGSGPDYGGGRFNSLALDQAGNPVVAHYDPAARSLRVAQWNGSAWTGEVVDAGEDATGDTGATVPADVGRYARLLIDGATERVAYYDAAAGDLKLATNDGSGWTIEVVDSEGDVGAWPSMMVHEGELWIAYQDVGAQDLKVAHGNPGAWTITRLDDGEYVGADTEIFLNGSYPAIFYFQGYDSDLKVAQLQGDTWTWDTVAGADAALGFHIETVVTGGQRYVASYDYTHRTVWASTF